jgi:hypothetical protein
MQVADGDGSASAWIPERITDPVFLLEFPKAFPDASFAHPASVELDKLCHAGPDTVPFLRVTRSAKPIPGHSGRPPEVPNLSDAVGVSTAELFGIATRRLFGYTPVRQLSKFL